MSGRHGIREFKSHLPDHFYQGVGQGLATRFGCESRKGYAGSNPALLTIFSGCKSVDGSRPDLESGALAHWRFEPSHPDHFMAS